MNKTKLTCLALTVLFLAAAGASGWFVYRRVPSSTAAFVGAVFGGVILVIALSWVSAIPKRIGEWWLIVRARSGQEPGDGQRVAAIGTLRGNGELQTPFSRERCVLYSYKIFSGTRKAYEGFAMVPLSIEDGTARTRLMAQPKLLRISSTTADGASAKSNAQRFIDTSTFTPPPAAKADADAGGHRFDYGHAPLEKNIGAYHLVETFLRPDTNVCAIGTYSATRQALVAPVTLRTGTSFGIDAAWRVVNAGIGSAIIVAFAIVIAAVFCANFPIDAVEQAHPERTLDWWEIDLERAVDKHVRTPLVQAGVLGTPGFRLQAVCEGCAYGRLEIDGRTIELTHAAYVGGRSVHLSAKRGDRDGVTLDGSERVVLTIGGKSADIPPSWLQPSDIETSLRENGEYAGRITIIAPHGGIRCRVTFRTRVDADAWLRQ